jgi:hypothetical protein
MPADYLPSFDPGTGEGWDNSITLPPFDPGTGEGWDGPITQPASPLSVNYYRQKVVEFQALLNNLQRAREATVEIVNNGPAELQPELLALLAELDGKIDSYRQVAEALNFGINGINRVGAGFPTLTIPKGLGVAPLVVAGGIGAAVAVAAALIVWGYAWIQKAQVLARQAQLYGYLTPEQRATVASKALELDQLAAASEASPLTSVANIAKWLGIAAVAYFAYQAYQKSR